jgi:hypothetical protein
MPDGHDLQEVARYNQRPVARTVSTIHKVCKISLQALSLRRTQRLERLARRAEVRLWSLSR